jgi:hypothetical protein
VLYPLGPISLEGAVERGFIEPFAKVGATVVVHRADWAGPSQAPVLLGPPVNQTLAARWGSPASMSG